MKTLSFKTILFTGLIFSAFSSQAFEISQHQEQDYLKYGGSPKALKHLKCFMGQFHKERYTLKSSSIAYRCNNLEENREIAIENRDYVVLVDYSRQSKSRRFFVFDLKNPTASLKSYFVSHGRFGNTSHRNTQLAPNRNSILDVEYYSNVLGSNASSEGFYITGQVYQGRWTGPQGDKKSLVLHGISRNKNDNACERLVVVHGNSYIRESGSAEGVRSMSSGCFMLDYDHVNEVVDLIRGGGGAFYPGEAWVGGSLFYTFGGSEESLADDYYCENQSSTSLRLESQ